MAIHWYAHHLGDYSKHTKELTLLEHGAYRLLMDFYYTKEGPFSDDLPMIFRACSAHTPPERRAIRKILSKYFSPRDGVWCHPRCDQEIGKRYGASEEAKERVSRKWQNDIYPSSGKKRSERLSEARKKGTHTNLEWITLLSSCGRKCVKCGSEEQIVKDHIVPIYQGGSDALSNLQPLCQPCNSSKGPDNTDYRPIECLQECLRNACKPTTYNHNQGVYKNGKAPGRSKSASEHVEISLEKIRAGTLLDT